MKSIIALFLVTASACSPEATALCEAKVECGLVTDVDTCLLELRTERDLALTRDCEDQYYEMIDCQIGVETTCGVPFETQFAQACSESTCRYTTCRDFPGGIAPPGFCGSEPPPPPPGGSNGPTGIWRISMTPTSDCPVLAYGYDVRVEQVGSAYELSSEGLFVNGTLSTSTSGATMSVRLSDGTARFYMLELFAASGGQTVTGSGNGSYNGGCSADVNVVGQIIRQ